MLACTSDKGIKRLPVITPDADALAYLIDVNDRLPPDTVLNKQTAARVRLTRGQ